jgi:hypothetical protein
MKTAKQYQVKHERNTNMNSVWGVIGRYAGIVTAGVFVITVGWAQAANVTPTVSVRSRTP